MWAHLYTHTSSEREEQNNGRRFCVVIRTVAGNRNVGSAFPYISISMDNLRVFLMCKETELSHEGEDEVFSVR